MRKFVFLALFAATFLAPVSIAAQELVNVYAQRGATLWGFWTSGRCQNEISLADFAAAHARSVSRPATEQTYRTLPVGWWQVPACGKLAQVTASRSGEKILRDSLDATRRTIQSLENRLGEAQTTIERNAKAARSGFPWLPVAIATIGGVLIGWFIAFLFGRNKTDGQDDKIAELERRNRIQREAMDGYLIFIPVPADLRGPDSPHEIVAVRDPNDEAWAWIRGSPQRIRVENLPDRLRTNSEIQEAWGLRARAPALTADDLIS